MVNKWVLSKVLNWVCDSEFLIWNGQRIPDVLPYLLRSISCLWTWELVSWQVPVRPRHSCICFHEARKTRKRWNVVIQMHKKQNTFPWYLHMWPVTHDLFTCDPLTRPLHMWPWAWDKSAFQDHYFHRWSQEWSGFEPVTFHERSGHSDHRSTMAGCCSNFTHPMLWVKYPYTLNFTLDQFSEIFMNFYFCVVFTLLNFNQ